VCGRPYWNEKFVFAIPGDFAAVSLYVVELVGPRQRESLVGKVSIPRAFFDDSQDLGDRWWPLHEVDDDSEVMGQVSVAVAVTRAASGGNSVLVHVVEGAAFAPGDLFCTVELQEANRTSDPVSTYGKCEVWVDRPVAHFFFF
jgi:hypothetical protein